MVSLRNEVLKCFKKLHRTSHYIFKGDNDALNAARLHINAEFRKNKDLSTDSKIKELVKHGHDVEHELRTTVIQAVQVKPGVYEAKIKPETVKFDNIPFNDCAILDSGHPKRKV